MVDLFISDTVKLCTDNNVKFTLINKNKVEAAKGIYCNGYFLADGSKLELVVACKKSMREWLPILVHESCHLDQYLSNPAKFSMDDDTGCIDEVLQGIKIPNKRFKSAIGKCKRLELDCEKRSADKIKKYNLPIDYNEYVQRSNLYIHFYNWVYINKMWVPKNKTLFCPDLISLMNTTFDKQFTTTPKFILDAIDKEFKT